MTDNDCQEHAPGPTGCVRLSGARPAPPGACRADLQVIIDAAQGDKPLKDLRFRFQRRLATDRPQLAAAVSQCKCSPTASSRLEADVG